MNQKAKRNPNQQYQDVPFDLDDENQFDNYSKDSFEAFDLKGESNQTPTCD